MTAETMRPKLLVLGATGTVGKAVMQQLTACGHGIRIGARTPRAATPLCEPAMVDLQTGDGLAAALDGIRALFLSTPDADWQGDAEHAITAAAARAGVQHVVKLSAVGADEGRYQLGRTHGAVEAAIRASGMAWTMLRPGAFMQNFATYYRHAIVEDGVLRLPCGTAPISFVDARDIARVAVLALTRPGHAGKSYTLLGPEPLTYQRALALLAAETGVTARYEAISEAAYRSAMAGTASTETIDRLADLYGYYARGGAAGPGFDLGSLAGSAATGFRAFARAASSDFSVSARPITRVMP